MEGNREKKRMRETKGRVGKAALKVYYTPTYEKSNICRGVSLDRGGPRGKKIAVLKLSKILSKRLHKRAMSFLN